MPTATERFDITSVTLYDKPPEAPATSLGFLFTKKSHAD